jgi:hypothetical protein
VLGQASLKSLKKLVPTIVQLVAMHCLKAIPNLKVAVAYQVFTNLLVKVQFFIRQIILMVWKEQKHNAFRCKAHGHVFEDAISPPTYLRYCINGVILDFEKAKDAEKNTTINNK